MRYSLDRELDAWSDALHPHTVCIHTVVRVVALYYVSLYA